MSLEQFWGARSFFHGLFDPKDRQAILQFAVVFSNEKESTGQEQSLKFYMVKKENMLKTRVQKLPHHLFRALEKCSRQDSCNQNCRNVHVQQEHLIELSTFGQKELVIALRGTAPMRVHIPNLDPTAGLLFACTLLELKLTSAIQPFVCKHDRYSNCHNGPKCLFIHASQRKIPEDIAPLLEATTPLREALFQVIGTPGLGEFLDSLISKGIPDMGSLQAMSTNTFEVICSRDTNPIHMPFWVFLRQLRDLDDAYNLMNAMRLFHGMTDEDIDSVPSNVSTIGALCKLKHKNFLALPLTIRAFEVCEKIRQRFEIDTNPYTTVNLTELPANAFFNYAANLVVNFRLGHTHKSWRKQDATRPVVTSMITYVNSCSCSASKQSRSIGSSPAMAGSRARSLCEDHPDSWCTCPRQFELAVNYELSTPSGSRCSEQNCLGKLASNGVPTHAIREVFVHGSQHNNDDPNPLFPCGVCENMLRRISKDVQKEYGAELMLYMFDAVNAPKKLVVIPFSEISHREGAMFRRFVEEDLKE